jgi:hypothetical protein
MCQAFHPAVRIGSPQPLTLKRVYLPHITGWGMVRYCYKSPYLCLNEDQSNSNTFCQIHLDGQYL